MNLTKAAIEKNRVTLVLLLVILIAGVMSYRKMPRDEDPGFIIRTALVMTYFPGASPERVEQLVTDRLEKAIQEIPELDFVNSESKTGVSIIYANMQESYKEMRPIWDDLRRKVDRVKPDLPEGVRGPFVNDEFGDVFGIVVTLTGEGYTYAEMKEVADQVRDELLLIDEAAKVEIHGAQEERVFVEYNNARLAEIGLSPYQLAQILETRNIIIPGGDITTQNERIVLEPTGNFESIDDLRRTVIKLPGREDVLYYLEDLAFIHRGYIDPPEVKMRFSGSPCLGLAINLREGGNIIRLGQQVKDTIRRLQQVYPIGIEFDFVAFQPMHVDKKVKSFAKSILQAILIVLGVMLVTLGIRTGLIVAPLVPMAMILSILVMSFLHIGLDQMSLAALIIALGMLVDNAIVMSESILVGMTEGKKRVQAALDAAQELRIPLLTSSLTTAAAFLPIYLAESNTGEYTAPLFKVVTIALLSSWVLSLTMTPFLCVTFMKVKKRADEALYDSRFYRIYRKSLTGILRHRLMTLAVTLAAFCLSVFGFRYLPNIFFPKNDKAIMTAEFELPPGTAIERTEEVVKEIEAFMAKELLSGPGRPEGIVNWATFIGQGAPRFVLNYNPAQAKPEYAVMVINTTSRPAVDELVTRMERFCEENVPDVTPTVHLLPLGPPATKPVEIRISGSDAEEVFRIVDKTRTRLAAVTGTKNVEDDWGARTKKLQVNVNQARARRAGLTSRDVALSLQTVLSGFESTEYREEDEVIPIVLRSVAADRKDIGKLEGLNIYVQSTGQSVPLMQIADVEVVWQPSKILRRDRLKTVTVHCDVAPDVPPIAVSMEMDEWLREESRDWKVGYKYELGGEMEKSVKANQSIMAKLPVAGFIILFLLVAQFNSFRRAFIILMTIPLGVIGVVIGLLAAHSYFGFMTLLGIISLAGIVINNAIVLIDRIRIEMEENGRSPQDAIIESAQRRLRPILLTTFTTVGGLLPLWFGGGPMWEPMAIAIIFGLLFATLLTLGVVPVLYSLFFRVSFREGVDS